MAYAQAMRLQATAFLLALVCSPGAASSPDTLVTNGGFESGLGGWRPLWCRHSGAGSLSLDEQVFHSGTNAARIEHSGAEDWSLEPELRVPARAGDIFEWQAWVRLQGEGSATLCVSTWDARGQNVSWSDGERTVHAGQSWQQLRSRFMVPP